MVIWTWPIDTHSAQIGFLTDSFSCEAALSIMCNPICPWNKALTKTFQFDTVQFWQAITKPMRDDIYIIVWISISQSYPCVYGSHVSNLINDPGHELIIHELSRMFVLTATIKECHLFTNGCLYSYLYLLKNYKSVKTSLKVAFCICCNLTWHRKFDAII